MYWVKRENCPGYKDLGGLWAVWSLLPCSWDRVWVTWPLMRWQREPCHAPPCRHGCASRRPWVLGTARVRGWHSAAWKCCKTRRGGLRLWSCLLLPTSFIPRFLSSPPMAEYSTTAVYARHRHTGAMGWTMGAGHPLMLYMVGHSPIASPSTCLPGALPTCYLPRGVIRGTERLHP